MWGSKNKQAALVFFGYSYEGLGGHMEDHANVPSRSKEGELNEAVCLGEEPRLVCILSSNCSFLYGHILE